MTDSSSDEEDYSKLLQAVDKQFINDRIFEQNSNIDTSTNKQQDQTLPPSLRNQSLDEWDQRNIIGLHVTPGFQKHIAKHLSTLLDRKLKEGNLVKNYKKKQSKTSKGIKLLLSSSSYLNCKDAEDISAAHNAKRKLRDMDVDSEEENNKVKEVAVTSDWVLTGEAVKGWAKNTKGEVFVREYNGKKKKKKKKNERNDSF